ncbi:hypothetical protein BDN72DRAFT_933053 [Pluteus cervinus]|uniref:Uncharacterized protein n=1 Tax=Pluteus cervinus TaxID=181527 RepID=A0ACD3A948_9AGAR|nr:hypothetical protein BDN72DRAFT_933053 [Pluteus cervinus]
MPTYPLLAQMTFSAPFPHAFLPELEDEIFSLALVDRIIDPVDLLLLSRRLKDRFGPQVQYTTVVSYSLKKYPQDLTRQSIKTHGHHTRHLLIGNDEDALDKDALNEDALDEDTLDEDALNEDAPDNDDEDSDICLINDIFRYCPNIERFALRGGYSLGAFTPGLIRMESLRYLSIWLDDLLFLDKLDDSETAGEADNVKAWATITRFLFSRITHLEIQGKIGSISNVKALSYFTSLTHLCVFRPTSKALVGDLLKMCPILEVLVLSDTAEEEDAEGPSDVLADILNYMEQSVADILNILRVHNNGANITAVENTEEIDPEMNEDTVDDARIVVIPHSKVDTVAAWKKDVRSGEDIWVKAEKIMQERTQKTA